MASMTDPCPSYHKHENTILECVRVEGHSGKHIGRYGFELIYWER